jgi:group II intron reverse transcriptase/maturase
MAQQFDSPKTETQLREIQDKLYQHSKEVYDAGGRPAFKGLLEIMTAEPTIVTAIHNIKSNKGSETPGVDFKTMRKDYLEKPYQWVIKDIQNAFKHFQAQKIRRKYIDKPGKTEKRPLGIPTIRDRIVQECMKIVLEPILEAQFFEHSYGFRPMRDTAMALERIKLVSHISGKYWIVEGDISKCFDNIDHSILLKHLYHIGIKDRRVLQIIKAMLKAGIMDECTVNEFGTPQGGIISPLLANAYLDIMDEWIAKQWEHKRTTHHYASSGSRRNALYKTSLTPGWLVRYADDFVIITDTRAHAEQWKARLQTFLQSKLKLTLSTEKTLITDVRKKHIHFLGYEFKMIPGNSRTGYITKTIPDRERLQRKVDSIAESIKKIPQNYSKEQVIGKCCRPKPLPPIAISCQKAIEAVRREMDTGKPNAKLAPCPPKKAAENSFNKVPRYLHWLYRSCILQMGENACENARRNTILRGRQAAILQAFKKETYECTTRRDVFRAHDRGCLL